MGLCFLTKVLPNILKREGEGSESYDLVRETERNQEREGEERREIACQVVLTKNEEAI